jgi:glyceraldehyde 3-phosphate dehydrogenase
MEHLLTAIRHDSTHGVCPQSSEISVAPSDHPGLPAPTENNPTPSALLFHGRLIHLLSQRDATKVDWSMVGAEYIMESTGKMTTKATAGIHITRGGARKVLISAPSADAPNVVR